MFNIKQFSQGELAKRLVISIILFSTVITIISTGIQLFLNYQLDIRKIEKNIDDVQHIYLESLAFSVWQLDDFMINTQLNGLMKLPDIEYLAIEVDGEVKWKTGSDDLKYTYTKSFPLTYQHQTLLNTEIGVITIGASIDAVYTRLAENMLFILVSNGIKTFIVAGFTLYLFFILVTRHLNTLTKYMEELDADRLDIPLNFQNKNETNKIPKEFDRVAHSINTMRIKLSQSYDSIKNNETDLKLLLSQREALLKNEKNHKKLLEKTVQTRTKELNKRSIQLEENSNSLKQSLETLNKTQEQLIESEKIAALGNLVAGVAHEINTPIGICMTTASWQKDQSIAMAKSLEEQTLTQNQLNSYLKATSEANDLIEKNIYRANSLIGSFKMVAIDQMHDIKKSFQLHEYLEEIINTIIPSFKTFKINFELNISEDIVLNSFSGALYQVFLNLITNTVIHGFGDRKFGNISINAEIEDSIAHIHYCDDGVGFSAEVSKSIFQPFFTTRRNKGGAGLGMSIVFNTVNGQLGGEILLADSKYGTGAGFNINIPLEAPDNQDNKAVSAHSVSNQ